MCRRNMCARGLKKQVSVSGIMWGVEIEIKTNEKVKFCEITCELRWRRRLKTKRQATATNKWIKKFSLRGIPNQKPFCNITVTDKYTHTRIQT